MHIGSEIKKLRKSAGITQKECAVRAGVGLRFLRELEQGKQTVRLDKTNLVLKLLGKQIGVTDE